MKKDTSGGPDIGPIKREGVPTMRLQQDGTDYFDLHHTPDDTFDKIDPDEMAKNTRIKLELEEYQKANPDKKVAPFGVNQICHPSNNRLQEDMEVCVKHEVPIIITSLQANQMVYDATHSYGGILLLSYRKFVNSSMGHCYFPVPLRQAALSRPLSR